MEDTNEDVDTFRRHGRKSYDSLTEPEIENNVYMDMEQQQHPNPNKRTASSPFNYKIIISTLGLLMLGALMALCAVGILYHYKVIFTEILSEKYKNATDTLVVLENEDSEKGSMYEMQKLKYQELMSVCNETERLHTELKVKYTEANERLSECSETERLHTELKVKYTEANEHLSECSEILSEKYKNATTTLVVLENGDSENGSMYEMQKLKYQELISVCNETERLHTELKVKYTEANEHLSECSEKGSMYEMQKLKYQELISVSNETERLHTELKVKYTEANERLSECSETERLYKELKVKYKEAHERLSACSANQNCKTCEEGWKPLGLKCYYFSTEKRSWTQSRDHCVRKGGHLVIITSQTEQNFVSSQIQVTNWIGLNDLKTEGEWMWVNNQPLKEMRLMFWFSAPKGPNEPDNWTKEDPSGEDCAALGDESGHINKWFDASCRKLKQFICEK